MLYSDYRFGRRGRFGGSLANGRGGICGQCRREDRCRAGQASTLRSEVDPANTWDLASLFPGDEAWDAAFAAYQKQIEGYAAFAASWPKARKSWPLASNSTWTWIGRAIAWGRTRC